jgi:hypothetical protein
VKLWLIESPNHDYDENESAVAWAETADDARELFWAHRARRIPCRLT